MYAHFYIKLTEELYNNFRFILATELLIWNNIYTFPCLLINLFPNSNVSN